MNYSFLSRRVILILSSDWSPLHELLNQHDCSNESLPLPLTHHIRFAHTLSQTVSYYTLNQSQCPFNIYRYPLWLIIIHTSTPHLTSSFFSLASVVTPQELLITRWTSGLIWPALHFWYACISTTLRQARPRLADFSYILKYYIHTNLWIKKIFFQIYFTINLRSPAGQNNPKA